MKIKAVFAVTLLLASFPLFAAYDAFLKIDTIPGESTAPGHQGWMDIDSFSWGATPAAAHTAASKCSLHSLNFTKKLDKASPMMAQAAMTGMLLPAVTVEVNGERHMLQNVQIRSVQNVNGATGPAQLVSLNFARCMTHEANAILAPEHKATIANGIIIKGDSNAMLAFGDGMPGDAVSMQDLHFTGPNQAVMTVRKAGGSNAILIGLLRASTSGKHIPVVSINARKAGGTQQEYYQIKLTDVLVSSYHGSGGGEGFDQVTLNFAKLDGPMAPFHDVFIK
jgi:type VI protein secretion system component Hcp